MSDEQNSSPTASPVRLTYDRETLAKVLGVSNRTLDRLRQRRDFPRPVRIGKRGRPLWSRDVIRRWLDEQSS